MSIKFVALYQSLYTATFPPKKEKMSKVRIVSVSRVNVPETLAPPPNGPVKLTFFDMAWIGLPPIQRLFLFPQTPALPSFPALVDALKSSLSATLLRFHPLAGELAFVPATGLVEIDCSAPLPGVAFVEAEAAADLDLARLVADPAHDAAAFRSLVPELDARKLPVPALAVQATAFPGGGAALGLSVHHAAVDGRALWLFVDAWAAACRGTAEPPLPQPTHDRAALFPHPFADEIARQLLRSVAPDLPVTTSPNFQCNGAADLARRTFVLDSEQIWTLKKRGSLGGGGKSLAPTSFVAVSAHVWTTVARSKRLKGAEPACLHLLADCRARIVPPAPEGYFGNCVKACPAEATAGDLIGEEGFARACAAIQSAIREYLVEDVGKQVPEGSEMRRLVNVSGSNRFKAYEVDFGWGKPGRVELVSMNYDGEVVMVCARDGEGVQVSVALGPAHMEAFASTFYDGLRP